MSTVGSQSTVVSGVNGKVILNGNTYAAGKSFSVDYGYKEDMEAVWGTHTPIANTAEFEGKMDMQILFSTEDTANKEQFDALLAQVNGQTPPINLVWSGADITSPTPVTRNFTLTGTFYPEKVGWKLEGPSMIKYTLSGKMTTKPVRT